MTSNNPVRTRRLGQTGLDVGELGLGTAATVKLEPFEVSECLRFALEHGVNFVDTAPVYGNEALFGEAMSGLRDRLVVATKVGGMQNIQEHRSSGALMEQFHGTLKQLKTSYVDIIQVHEADYRRWWKDESGIHLEELIRDDEEYDFAGAPVVEFLHRAIESGKARFIGLSGKNARLIARILESIDVDTILVAHQFNPIYRNAESFLFPQTEEKGVGVMLGAVLMKGWLALPMLEWQKERPSWMDEPFARSYFQFVELSQTSGIPMAELTIRWVLEESRQHCLLFGFKSQEDICHNLAYAIKGPMPADIKTEIDNIGFVHPLIYQGRDAL